MGAHSRPSNRTFAGASLLGVDARSGGGREIVVRARLLGRGRGI